MGFHILCFFDRGQKELKGLLITHVHEQPKLDYSFWMDIGIDDNGEEEKLSVDAKVAKAQLHAYEVLTEHVEDAKPSVDGFKTMIEKMVKGGADGSDDKRPALLNKNQQIDDRYKELLNSAVD